MNLPTHTTPFFVYGTLRPDCGNDRLWHGVADAHADNAAFAPGFQLVGRHSAFPYVVPADSVEDVVVGALIYPRPGYEATVARDMDALEGVGYGHYRRHITRVYVFDESGEGPRVVESFIYVPGPRTMVRARAMTRITTGNWKNQEVVA